MRKWTNKADYSPWERERREREVLQNGKGGVLLGWLTTVTDNLIVCESISQGVLVFLSHAVSITMEGLWKLAVLWLTSSCGTEDCGSVGSCCSRNNVDLLRVSDIQFLCLFPPVSGILPVYSLSLQSQLAMPEQVILTVSFPHFSSACLHCVIPSLYLWTNIPSLSEFGKFNLWITWT